MAFISSPHLTDCLPRKPLQGVILGADDAVWIRTADEQSYPAPQLPAAGMSHGYSGSGPDTPASLLGRLLDDINTPAADHHDVASDVLRELTETDWSAGTALTRA